jgi:photosystem II stability/assembly factor-like uncharacterized protein
VWAPSINPSFILLLIITFLSSCKKESIQLPWTELSSGVNSTLTDIRFLNTQEGFIVGGSTWFEGIYLSTDNGGNTWTTEVLGEKQLFGLDFNNNGNTYTVGIDGQLFVQKRDASEWVFYQTPRFDILRDVAFNSDNTGVLVGGVAFNKGTIMLVDSSMSVTRVDTLGFQLNAVCYSEKQVVHTVGYGIILRSNDGGLTWQESETTGDHFTAISFPNANVGYIAGANGTILKSTDAGLSWKKIRNGDAITVSDKAFRDIYFLDEDYGYIIGEGGLCWRTEDGGDNWIIIDGFPDIDFNAISIIDGFGFIVGDEGRIIRFEE